MEICRGADAEQAAPGSPEGLTLATIDGFPVWQGSLSDAGTGIEARFVGRGPDTRPTPIEELPARLGLRGIERLAWAKQVHSARVLDVPAGALPGECGEGDALVTYEKGVATAVVTADCVPVLLAAVSPDGSGKVGPVAAVHAGWRGVVAGIVPEAAARLRVSGDEIAAWVGPAVGACCYEVGEDVAEEIVAAAEEQEGDGGPRVLYRRSGGCRPHVDVAAAVLRQLAAAGVRVVGRAGECTFCSGGGLASYRRDGKGAGRNVALIWRPA